MVKVENIKYKVVKEPFGEYLRNSLSCLMRFTSKGLKEPLRQWKVRAWTIC